MIMQKLFWRRREKKERQDAQSEGKRKRKGKMHMMRKVYMEWRRKEERGREGGGGTAKV